MRARRARARNLGPPRHSTPAAAAQMLNKERDELRGGIREAEERLQALAELHRKALRKAERAKDAEGRPAKRPKA